jgi:hypothetical protein
MVGLGDLPPPPAHAEVYLLLAGPAQLASGLADVVPLKRGAPFVAGIDIAPGRADVVAGREVVPGAGQHDDPDIVILNGAVEGVIQRVGHLGVLRVAVFRPVHRDQRGRTAPLIDHHVSCWLAHCGLGA